MVQYFTKSCEFTLIYTVDGFVVVATYKKEVGYTSVFVLSNGCARAKMHDCVHAFKLRSVVL